MSVYLRVFPDAIPIIALKTAGIPRSTGPYDPDL